MMYNQRNFRGRKSSSKGGTREEPSVHPWAEVFGGVSTELATKPTPSNESTGKPGAEASKEPTTKNESTGKTGPEASKDTKSVKSVSETMPSGNPLAPALKDTTNKNAAKSTFISQSAGKPGTQATNESAGNPGSQVTNESAGNPGSQATNESAGNPGSQATNESAGNPGSQATNESAGNPGSQASEVKTVENTADSMSENLSAGNALAQDLKEMSDKIASEIKSRKGTAGSKGAQVVEKVTDAKGSEYYMENPWAQALQELMPDESPAEDMSEKRSSGNPWAQASEGQSEDPSLLVTGYVSGITDPTSKGYIWYSRAPALFMEIKYNLLKMLNRDRANNAVELISASAMGTNITLDVEFSMTIKDQYKCIQDHTCHVLMSGIYAGSATANSRKKAKQDAFDNVLTTLCMPHHRVKQSTQELEASEKPFPPECFRPGYRPPEEKQKPSKPGSADGKSSTSSSAQGNGYSRAPAYLFQMGRALVAFGETNATWNSIEKVYKAIDRKVSKSDLVEPTFSTDPDTLEHWCEVRIGGILAGSAPAVSRKKAKHAAFDQVVSTLCKTFLVISQNTQQLEGSDKPFPFLPGQVNPNTPKGDTTVQESTSCAASNNTGNAAAPAWKKPSPQSLNNNASAPSNYTKQQFPGTSQSYPSVPFQRADQPYLSSVGGYSDSNRKRAASNTTGNVTAPAWKKPKSKGFNNNASASGGGYSNPKEQPESNQSYPFTPFQKVDQSDYQQPSQSAQSAGPDSYPTSYSKFTSNTNQGYGYQSQQQAGMPKQQYSPVQYPQTVTPQKVTGQYQQYPAMQYQQPVPPVQSYNTSTNKSQQQVTGQNLQNPPNPYKPPVLPAYGRKPTPGFNVFIPKKKVEYRPDFSFEKLILYEPKHKQEGMNPAMILNQTADFNHIPLDYEIWELRGRFHGVLKLNDKPMSEVTCRNELPVKNRLADKALKSLRETNYTIQIKKREKTGGMKFHVDHVCDVSIEDVMMKMMYWNEGGDGYPWPDSQDQFITKETLANTSVEKNQNEFVTELTKLMTEYSNSSGEGDVVFSPLFTNPERRLIKDIALKTSEQLSHKTYCDVARNISYYVVVNKKKEGQLLRHLLRNCGETDAHILIPPGQHEELLFTPSQPYSSGMQL